MAGFAEATRRRRGELHIGAKGPKRRDDGEVNPAVRLAQGAHRRLRGGHRVGQFTGVPHGATTGGAAHRVEPEPLNAFAVVSFRGGLVPPEGKAAGIPAIEAEIAVARPRRPGVQDRVQRHVLPAGTRAAVEPEVPGEGVRA